MRNIVNVNQLDEKKPHHVALSLPYIALYSHVKHYDMVSSLRVDLRFILILIYDTSSNIYLLIILVIYLRIYLFIYLHRYFYIFMLL